MIKIDKGHRVASSASFQCKNISIGKNCVIHERATFLGDSISIGDNVWVGQDAVLDGTGGLEIGDNVTIGIRCSVFTHAGTRGFMLKKAAVVIKDCAWLMSNATVNPGVTVGRDSRVYNAAVVVENVPDATAVAGVPARAVGKIPAGERMSAFLKKQARK